MTKQECNDEKTMNKNIRRHVGLIARAIEVCNVLEAWKLRLKVSQREVARIVARKRIAVLLSRHQAIMKAVNISALCMPEKLRETAMRLSVRVMKHNMKLRAYGTELWVLKSIENMRTW